MNGRDLEKQIERDYAWAVFGIALLILLAVIGVCADQVWGAAGDPLAQEVQP